MAPTLRNSRSELQTPSSGALLIAIGLGILIFAAWIPAVPVIAAMAILTLGATDATLARFRGTAALRHVILLHAATYSTLYVLFVGATLHAVGAAAAAPVSRWTLFDLAASTLPLGLAAQRIVAVLRQSAQLKR